MDGMFRLELTDEQQASFGRITGLRKKTIDVAPRKLGAYALAAVAAGRDVLPISSSPDTIRYMLDPDSFPDGTATPFVIWIRLTEAQSEQIHTLIGRTMRSVAVAPEEESAVVHYLEAWDSHEPFQIGHSLTVLPAGATAPDGAGDRVIHLPPRDGKAAFGTGRHPTTRAITTKLEDCIRPGDTVLDVGTGSGILAVAAVRLGARSVLGVEIDKPSVDLARELIALNGVEEQVEIREGSVEVTDEQYDIVLMNLLPDIILSIAPQLDRLLRPNGRVVTSGITEARARRLTRGMAGFGFRLVDQVQVGDWVGQQYEKDSAMSGSPGS